MKKTAAFIFALTLILSATSCSEKKKSEIKDSPAAVTISQTTYGAEEVYLDEINDLMYVSETAVYDEGVCIFYNSYDEKSKFARLDKDFNVVCTAPLSEDNKTSMTNCVYSDGSFDYISIETNFEFEYDENNQITNWEQYYAEANFTFCLVSCDRDGNVISKTEIVGAGEYFDAEIPGMSQLVSCGEDRMMFKFGSGLIIFDKEGNIIDADSGDQYSSINIAATTDGRIICHEHSSYGFMSPDSAAIPADLTYVKELSSCYLAPVTGTGAFLAYFSFSDGLYGLTDSGNFIQVIDYGKSLMTSNNGTILPYDEGVFIACNGGNKLNIYRRRPDDYVEKRQAMDIWMIENGGTGLHDTANNFCLTHDDYLINIKEMVYFDDLSTAILAGDGPDMLYYGSSNYMPDLVNLGALEDLTPYLDGNTGLSKDVLVPNYLDAFSYKGGMYTITDSFNVSVCITNKDIVGEEYRNWSTADLLDIYDNMPPGTMLTDDQYSDRMLLFSNAWIDYDNYICNYDCDEFIRLLDICKEHEKNFPETDYEDLDSLKEYYCRLKNGEAIIGQTIDFHGMGTVFNNLGFCEMALEDISLLHYPGCKGEVSFQRAYSILANSDCKDGAWEFISYAINEKYQEPYGVFGFSTNNNNFIRDLNRYVDPPTGRSTETTTFNGFPYTYESSTSQEQIDRIYDYVVSCKTMSYSSHDVDDILREEYGRFEKDEITAEECARNLQERISIMLSEMS